MQSAKAMWLESPARTRPEGGSVGLQGVSCEQLSLETRLHDLGKKEFKKQKNSLANMIGSCSLAPHVMSILLTTPEPKM